MLGGPLPGDSGGTLALTFLLTEIVSVFSSHDAPRDELGELNARFTDFRTCDAAELADAGRRLGDYLDALADGVPR